MVARGDRDVEPAARAAPADADASSVPRTRPAASMPIRRGSARWSSNLLTNAAKYTPAGGDDQGARRGRDGDEVRRCACATPASASRRRCCRREASPEIPSEIEEHRDRCWRRENARQVSTAIEAERLIDQVGFAACLTDSRRPGPSLYIAVCGRRDAVMPRNVQKDEEASLAWVLKDEVIRRGNVYYAKLARGKATFIAPRMVPYFNAIWGLRRSDEPGLEPQRAEDPARAAQRVGDGDVGSEDRFRRHGSADVHQALDELQAAMLVIPSAVYYEPKFTYIWTLASAAFRMRCESASGASGGEGNRALLPDRRGADDSGRARARHRIVAAGGRPRQSRARQGRVRDDARAGLVSTGQYC